MKDRGGEIAAELPAELVRRADPLAQQSRRGRPGAQRTGIAPQRMRRRARDAVERLGCRESEERASEICDGLEIEARRRTGIIVACERNRGAAIEQGAHRRFAVQAQDIRSLRDTRRSRCPRRRSRSTSSGADAVAVIDRIDASGRPPSRPRRRTTSRRNGRADACPHPRRPPDSAAFARVKRIPVRRTRRRRRRRGRPRWGSPDRSGNRRRLLRG